MGLDVTDKRFRIRTMPTLNLNPKYNQDMHGPFSVVLRNDLIRVKHFFEEKHRNKYKIFNLCAEKVYDEQKFGELNLPARAQELCVLRP